MKKIYLDIPQCRRCGSWNTGIYMSGLLVHEWLIKKALKRGIYILLVPPQYDINSMQPNCFCGSCGVSWREDNIHWKLISEEEFNEKLKLRNIETALENSTNFFEIAKENRRQEIKYNKWYRKLGRKIKAIRDKRRGLF